ELASAGPAERDPHLDAAAAVDGAAAAAADLQGALALRDLLDRAPAADLGARALRHVVDREAGDAQAAADRQVRHARGPAQLRRAAAEARDARLLAALVGAVV